MEFTDPRVRVAVASAIALGFIGYLLVIPYREDDTPWYEKLNYDRSASFRTPFGYVMDDPSIPAKMRTRTVIGYGKGTMQQSYENALRKAKLFSMGTDAKIWVGEPERDPELMPNRRRSRRARWSRRR